MEYYYLISSLPPISAEISSHTSLPISDLCDLIQRNLDDRDQEIYRAILHQNDNRNLLSILVAEKFGKASDHYSTPNLINPSLLQDFNREAAAFPDYLVDFIQHLRVNSTSMAEIELELYACYYNYIRSLKSPFLSHYFSWKRNLHECIAELNQKYFSFGQETTKTLTFDFGSLAAIPIDRSRVFQELEPIIAEQRLADLEKAVDRYYWEFAENYRVNFSSGSVFGYVVKLLRLGRWASLMDEPEEKDSLLTDLLEKIESDNMKSSITL